jgi:hypothetical protein
VRPEDRDLSRLFEAARRADESAAPELDALLALTRPRRHAPAVRIFVLAAATASLIAIAVLLVHGGARVAPAPEPPLQLADWESPTGFLLDTPGSELLTEIPTLAVPPIAGDAGGSQPTKGVAR